MGARNKRTVAVEQAMQVVAERLKEVVPGAFEGDGVAYMQSVYRDPSFPPELRLDAAAKAARFERPALAATLNSIPIIEPVAALFALPNLSAGSIAD